jgi:hypothetical protein
MDDEPRQIAYTALLPGTPVQSSDGQQIGRVDRVLIVEEVDVFDGIVIECAAGTRFIDADQVGQIFTTHVCTTVAVEAVGELPTPDQSPVYGVNANDDTGSSFGDRIGRMFGRGKWKRER